jgi:hypothetical protein
MASLKGLALYAQQNQIMGHALIVNVGNVQRCVTVEMANNRMSGTTVPSIRFICDGYCGLVAKHPSKQCKTVDRNAQIGSAPVAAPPGLVRDSGGMVSMPYAPGGSGTPATNVGLLH